MFPFLMSGRLPFTVAVRQVRQNVRMKYRELRKFINPSFMGQRGSGAAALAPVRIGPRKAPSQRKKVLWIKALRGRGGGQVRALRGQAGRPEKGVCDSAATTCTGG